MLFLLKRNWGSALAAMAILTSVALVLRYQLQSGPGFGVSWQNTLLGLGVFAGVAASDLFLHTFFSRTCGDSYRKRYRALAGLFNGQPATAVLAGAAMAGVGEELVFRGLSTDVVYLTTAAVVFGLLHHVRRSLWPFTLWALYQGFLFAAALSLTGSLFVTMVAHFAHDLAGFLVFHHLNQTMSTHAALPPG